MRRALIHYIGNSAPMLSGLVTAPMTARALEVDGRAEIVILTTVSAIFVVAGSMGLGWIVRDEVAADRLSLLYWRSVGIRVAVTALPVGVILGAGLALGLGLGASAFTATLLLFGLSGLAASRAVDANALVSLGRSDHVGLSNAMYASSVLISMVILFAVGRLTVASAVLANGIGLILQMVVLRTAIRGPSRLEPAAQTRRRAELEASSGGIGSLWRRSARSWLTQLLDATSTRWDLVVVLCSQSKNLVGLYSVIALMPQTAYRFYSSITQASFTKFPELSSPQRLAMLVHVNAAAGVTISAVGVTIAYPALPFVFGEEFEAARGFLAPGGFITVSLALFVAVIQDIAREGLFVLASLSASAAVVLAGLCSVMVGPILGLSLLAFLVSVGSLSYAFLRTGRSLLEFDLRRAVALFR